MVKLPFPSFVGRMRVSLKTCSPRNCYKYVKFLLPTSDIVITDVNIYLSVIWDVNFEYQFRC